jgi:hypothetical protein
MLSTPHKPHSESKLGKKALENQAPQKESEAQRRESIAGLALPADENGGRN